MGFIFSLVRVLDEGFYFETVLKVGEGRVKGGWAGGLLTPGSKHARERWA